VTIARSMLGSRRPAGATRLSCNITTTAAAAAAAEAISRRRRDSTINLPSATAGGSRCQRRRRVDDAAASHRAPRNLYRPTDRPTRTRPTETEAALLQPLQPSNFHQPSSAIAALERLSPRRTSVASYRDRATIRTCKYI